LCGRFDWGMKCLGKYSGVGGKCHEVKFESLFKGGSADEYVIVSYVREGVVRLNAQDVLCVGMTEKHIVHLFVLEEEG